MGQLNNTGYQVKSFSDYKTELQAMFQNAFGMAIDLSETSPQGNLINAMAEWCENADKIGLDVFRSMNIMTASGISLDFIALLRRVVRNAGIKAVIDVELTSSSFPYTILAGEKFSNDNGDEFVLEADALITTSPQTIQLVASNSGELDIETGDKLTSVSFINQLQDIEITTYSNGTNTETDKQLRERLRLTNGENANATVESIYYALRNTDNVLKVNVLENASGTPNGLGMPAHSIEALVLGGLDLDVANAIFSRNPAGTIMFGTTTIPVVDVMLNSHDVSFTRPTQKRVYVKCTAIKKEFQLSIDTTFFNDMKAEVKEYVANLRIGENVSYTTIYGIFAKYNAFDIVSLELSFDGIVWQTITLNINVKEYAEIVNLADVEIVVL